jgi:hypothetical protein
VRGSQLEIADGIGGWKGALEGERGLPKYGAAWLGAQRGGPVRLVPAVMTSTSRRGLGFY